mmetsp:Transcript_12825/g.37375  ORF Transcript_12825/g.37375 Transcript_12825/m.37375 type:complete len:215 (-) Transcript_12825:1085-1729(-)
MRRVCSCCACPSGWLRLRAPAAAPRLRRGWSPVPRGTRCWRPGQKTAESTVQPWCPWTPLLGSAPWTGRTVARRTGSSPWPASPPWRAVFPLVRPRTAQRRSEPGSCAALCAGPWKRGRCKRSSAPRTMPSWTWLAFCATWHLRRCAWLWPRRRKGGSQRGWGTRGATCSERAGPPSGPTRRTHAPWQSCACTAPNCCASRAWLPVVPLEGQAA